MLPQYYLTAAADLGFVASVIGNLIAYILLTRRLKSNHHAVWEELGGPTVARRGTFRDLGNFYRVLIFAAARGYERLGDERLPRFSRYFLATNALTVIMLVFVLTVPHYQFSGITSDGRHWRASF